MKGARSFPLSFLSLSLSSVSMETPLSSHHQLLLDGLCALVRGRVELGGVRRQLHGDSVGFGRKGGKKKGQRRVFEKRGGRTKTRKRRRVGVLYVGVGVDLVVVVSEKGAGRGVFELEEELKRPEKLSSTPPGSGIQSPRRPLLAIITPEPSPKTAGGPRFAAVS